MKNFTHDRLRVSFGAFREGALGIFPGPAQFPHPTMRFQRSILAIVFGLLLPLCGLAAEGHGESEGTSGLPTAAPVLFNVGPLPVTNSMVLTWFVAAMIILGAQFAMRKSELIPHGAQNFWEWLVEGLYNFLTDLIGSHLVKKTFWFFGSLFIFIVATNWSGLVPGVGTIGYGVQTSHGFHVTQPLFRGAHADFNMTFAMSLVFFALWTIWAIQENGFTGFLKHIFAPKGETSGALFVINGRTITGDIETAVRNQRLFPSLQGYLCNHFNSTVETFDSIDWACHSMVYVKKYRSRKFFVQSG